MSTDRHKPLHLQIMHFYFETDSSRKREKVGGGGGRGRRQYSPRFALTLVKIIWNKPEQFVRKVPNAHILSTLVDRFVNLNNVYLTNRIYIISGINCHDANGSTNLD